MTLFPFINFLPLMIYSLNQMYRGKQLDEKGGGNL